MKDEDKKLWEMFVNGTLRLNTITPEKLNSVRCKISPISKVLDLHNYSVQDAYFLFGKFIETHYEIASKKITVITGKSGQIRSEFETWAANNKQINAIKLKANGGSFTIQLSSRLNKPKP